jgi:hypothetical protein
MAFAKKCKYGCNTMIVWRDTEGKFYEQDTNEQHTKDRCAEAQGKASITQPATKGYFKTGQDQKSEDIKAAQLQRKKEHDELIKNMQWLTKAIAQLNETQGGGAAKEILENMGFEDYRSEQQNDAL